MKRATLISALALFITSAGLSYGADTNTASPALSAADYFKLLRSETLAKLPDSFSGELVGGSINKKMESIPKDAYSVKNKSPYVEISYSKKKGIAVVVRNVDELYRDLYRDLPRQFFAFDILLSTQTTNTIYSKYDYSYQRQEGDSVVLKLTVRGAENALLIYVDKTANEIKRVDYAMGKDFLSSTIIVYEEFENAGRKVKIPVKFLTKVITQDKDSRPDIFDIKNVKIKGS